MLSLLLPSTRTCLICCPCRYLWWWSPHLTLLILLTLLTGQPLSTWIWVTSCLHPACATSCGHCSLSYRLPCQGVIPGSSCCPCHVLHLHQYLLCHFHGSACPHKQWLDRPCSVRSCTSLAIPSEWGPASEHWDMHSCNLSATSQNL